MMGTAFTATSVIGSATLVLALVSSVMLLTLLSMRGPHMVRPLSGEHADEFSATVNAAPVHVAIQRVPVRHKVPDRNDCAFVPSPAFPSDSMDTHAAVCAGLCRKQPGFKTHGTSDVRITDGGITCRCCDPAASAELLTDGTLSTGGVAQNCRAGVNFGIVSDEPHKRALYVENECGGAFRWGGNEVMTCKPGANGARMFCDYDGTALTLSDGQVQVLDDYISVMARQTDTLDGSSLDEMQRDSSQALASAGLDASSKQLIESTFQSVLNQRKSIAQNYLTAIQA